LEKVKEILFPTMGGSKVELLALMSRLRDYGWEPVLSKNGMAITATKIA